jgi:voltage-gated potassium channel
VGDQRNQSALGAFFRRPPAATRAAIFVAVMIVYSTAGFLFFEKPAKPELTWVDAFWWTLVTLATVGYGDFFPATVAGRLLIGIPAMLTGVGILSYALSQVGAYFVRTESNRRRGLVMQKLSGHILVCNHPSQQRVTRLLRELRAHPDLTDVPAVLVDELLPELDDALMADGVRFVRGHPARTETLQRASVESASRAVILARDSRDAASDHLTVSTCLALKQLRPDLHVVAECVDPDNVELLERAGCESVICIHDLAPGILAQEVHEPGVVRVLEALTTGTVSANLYVVPLVLDDRPHSFAELQRHAGDRGLVLLGLRTGTQVSVNPPPTTALTAGDAAIVVARSRPPTLELTSDHAVEEAG